jgi:sulfur relay (sulfurtransferase) complex TusBCD TusD component (DsrE family)
MIPPLFGKQEVGIWRVEKRIPRYGVPLWSLWPNIRSLPSIVSEKNVTKNVHICSMCIKTNWVGKQEVGIWRIQKRFLQYGIPIWSLWPNISFLSSIVAEKYATKNGHIQNVCSMCIKINKVGKQEVGIWWIQKRFPQYGVPIWSLWPNIRSLPSTVAEKNVTKNVHIQVCSMCIKTNGVGKQEVGIWWVQKRFPQYGIPIWSLRPNIRFLSSIVT